MFIALLSILSIKTSLVGSHDFYAQKIHNSGEIIRKKNQATNVHVRFCLTVSSSHQRRGGVGGKEAFFFCGTKEN